MSFARAPMRYRAHRGLFCATVPFPPYSLTNLGANIRRLQKRLTEIEAKAKAMAEAPARAAEVLDAERASGGAGGGIR